VTVPRWLRVLFVCVLAVAAGALVAGRFGAILVGGLALWGLGASALPALVEHVHRRRRR
jgi:hypothetical protein